MTVREHVGLSLEQPKPGHRTLNGVGHKPPTRPTHWRHWTRTHFGLLLLAGIPVVVFGGLAASGHVLMEADNLIQNFPLRSLVGVDLRHGHLPLWDPYLASGTPLLGGFNAGAAYPGTWLFAVLPAQGAWTVNVIAVYEVTLFGMFFFLRRQTVSVRAATLGAAAFTFGGFMSAQFVHIDLIEGAAWLPWMLIALEGMADAASGANDTRATGGTDRPPPGRPDWRRLTRFAALLAAAYGLSILAGAPEAFLDGGVLAAVYGLWLLRRLQRGRPPYLIAVLAGTGGALLLGAAQWLPGSAFSRISQRAVPDFAYFTSGSWPIRLTSLLFSPFLLGTNQDHPSYYFGPFNFPEVTGYVGLVSVVAVFALTSRRWWRHPTARRWKVWYFVLVLGLLMAWGGYTPFSRLVYLVPLLNKQRLLSRNLLIVDFALAVLAAWWIDLALLRRPNDGTKRPGTSKDGPAVETSGVPTTSGVRRVHRQRLLVVVPVSLVILLCGGEWLSTTTWWENGLPRLLGEHLSTNHDGLMVMAGVATLGAALIISIGALARFGSRLSVSRVAWLTALIMAIDLLVFNAFVLRPPEPQTVVTQSSATGDQLAALSGTRSRFAVYDPDLYRYSDLLQMGQGDLNVLRGLPTVEDYTALVDKGYFQATGAHGQDELAAGVFSTTVLNQLNLGLLLSVPNYFMSPVDAARSSLRQPNPPVNSSPRPPPGAQDVLLGPPRVAYLVCRGNGRAPNGDPGPGPYRAARGCGRTAGWSFHRHHGYPRQHPLAAQRFERTGLCERRSPVGDAALCHTSCRPGGPEPRTLGNLAGPACAGDHQLRCRDPQGCATEPGSGTAVEVHLDDRAVCCVHQLDGGRLGMARRRADHRFAEDTGNRGADAGEISRAGHLGTTQHHAVGNRALPGRRVRRGPTGQE